MRGSSQKTIQFARYTIVFLELGNGNESTAGNYARYILAKLKPAEAIVKQIYKTVRIQSTV